MNRFELTTTVSNKEITFIVDLSYVSDENDPHRQRDEPHYRLYLGRDGKPCIIEVQWFDYFDYKADRFLSPDAWDDETEAKAALSAMESLWGAGFLFGSSVTVRRLDS